jgi:protein arginine N-methyltransferase 1
VRPLATNTWSKGRPKPAQLLTEPKCWATLDYGSIDQPHVRGELTWTPSRAGTAYGLSLWFDAVLAEGVGYSNSPMSPELIYGNAFFPLLTPVPLAAADSVSVKLEADLVGDDYVWRWQTCVLTQGDPAQVKARFDQSTFFGAPLCPNRLHKRAAGYMPRLSEDGQIDRFVLGLMDGQRSLDQVARCLGQRFPARFATLEQALSHVGDLSQRYS